MRSLEIIEIIFTCRCRECNGIGIVKNELYIEFDDFLENWKKENKKPSTNYSDSYIEWVTKFSKAQISWWEGKGYLGGGQDWLELEKKCERCAGTGREKISISLDNLERLIECGGFDDGPS